MRSPIGSRGILTLPAAVALLSPGAAWACGTCVDMIVRNSAWWGTWPYWALLALLLDTVGVAVYAKVRLPPPPAAEKTRFVNTVVGALLPLLAVAFFGTLLPAALSSLVLLVFAVRSRGAFAARPAGEKRALWSVRLAALGGFAAAFVATSLPSTVPTETLLKNVLYKGPRLDPPGWCETELKRRDGLASVTSALDKEVAADGKFLTSHGGHLVLLHEFLAGPPAARKAACDVWRVQGEKASPRLAKACGGAPRAP